MCSFAHLALMETTWNFIPRLQHGKFSARSLRKTQLKTLRLILITNKEEYKKVRIQKFYDQPLLPLAPTYLTMLVLDSWLSYNLM